MANTNVTMRIDETLKAQLQAYKLAMQNTNYNKEGKTVISSDDEWNDETEWDDIFEQMKKRKRYRIVNKGESGL